VVCVRRWRRKIRGRMRRIRGRKVRRWEFESWKVLPRVPGSWFALFVDDEGQKTTGVVKRKRRAGQVCRWHELTRRDVTWRDVTWRDVTWRRSVEMLRDEMATPLGSLASLLTLLLCACSTCHARITNQEIGECWFK